MSGDGTEKKSISVNVKEIETTLTWSTHRDIVEKNLNTVWGKLDERDSKRVT